MKNPSGVVSRWALACSVLVGIALALGTLLGHARLRP
jgi:hypothetical protein